MSTCAASLRQLGNAANGFKLQARFPEPRPAKVQVSGSTDINNVNGNSGMWMSKNTYSTLECTLILQDSAGATLSECSYGPDGMLITDRYTEFTFVSATKFTEPDANGNPVPRVSVNWSVGGQINLVKFEVHRSSTATGIFTKINSSDIDFTGDIDYSFLDSSPLAGENFYKVVGKRADGQTTSTSKVVQAL